MSGLGIKCGPAVFGDLRGWIDALREGGELAEITGEVDWDVELGNIIRMMQGSGDGPAFLFSNMKDYNGPDALCYRMFTGGHASYSRIAMMFGLPPSTPARMLAGALSRERTCSARGSSAGRRARRRPPSSSTSTGSRSTAGARARA